jgi:mRNA degradation ribonuclease J1/J2
MNIHIHRGQNQIGGNIIEISTDTTKIILDVGLELDDDKKAAMVSNLLVVLCADEQAKPVVNTGTLYQ